MIEYNDELVQFVREQVDYFNSLAEGKSLAAVISDEKYLVLSTGVVRMTMEGYEQDPGESVVRAIIFGIFLGEIGRTKLTGGRDLQ